MARCECTTVSAMLALRPASWAKKQGFLNLWLLSQSELFFFIFFQFFVEKSIEVPILLYFTGHTDEPALLLFKKM